MPFAHEATITSYVDSYRESKPTMDIALRLLLHYTSIAVGAVALPLE